MKKKEKSLKYFIRFLFGEREVESFDGYDGFRWKHINELH